MKRRTIMSSIQIIENNKVSGIASNEVEELASNTSVPYKNVLCTIKASMLILATAGLIKAALYKRERRTV